MSWWPPYQKKGARVQLRLVRNTAGRVQSHPLRRRLLSAVFHYSSLLATSLWIVIHPVCRQFLRRSRRARRRKLDKSAFPHLASPSVKGVPKRIHQQSSSLLRPCLKLHLKLHLNLHSHLHLYLDINVHSHLHLKPPLLQQLTTFKNGRKKEWNPLKEPSRREARASNSRRWTGKKDWSGNTYNSGRGRWVTFASTNAYEAAMRRGYY